MTTALACVLLLVAVCLLAVLRPIGQRFEDAVLSAADRAARGADAARAQPVV